MLEMLKKYFGLIVLIAIVIVLWLTNAWFLYGIQDRGTFGDMFGGINALFSGLAFATLIYTIHLQSKELQYQREELEETRNEIRGQKEHLAAQNEVLKIQNFENTFFQLLGLLQQTRDTFSYSVSSGLGIKAFEYAFRVFTSQFVDIHNAEVNKKTSKDVIIKIATTQFFTNQQINFGHYFRTLYNLIKLVDRSNISDKRLYTNLIRAQLSNPEVIILFYDCLSELGNDKFKPLVEKYALLKVIKPNMLLDPEHYNLYSTTAYK